MRWAGELRLEMYQGYVLQGDLAISGRRLGPEPGMRRFRKPDGAATVRGVGLRLGFWVLYCCISFLRVTE